MITEFLVLKRPGVRLVVRASVDAGAAGCAWTPPGWGIGSRTYCDGSLSFDPLDGRWTIAGKLCSQLSGRVGSQSRGGEAGAKRRQRSPDGGRLCLRPTAQRRWSKQLVSIWRILFPCRAFLAFSVVAREAALHFASLLASARFSGGLEKIDGSSWIVVRRRLAVCNLFMVG